VVTADAVLVDSVLVEGAVVEDLVLFEVEVLPAVEAVLTTAVAAVCFFERAGSCPEASCT
jgi:hypothetical protein